jgi:peptidyl-prolyl cis-trans isomerase SurA
VASAATLKPGKKEKIRFGQAPTKTLPSSAPTETIDAGANANAASPADAAARNGGASDTQLAANGDAPALGDISASSAPEKKSRFSDRAKIPKEKKSKEPKVDPFAPPPVTSQEVADRQTQSAPLGLAGDTSKTKKAKPTEKTRLQDQLKNKKAAPDDSSGAADSSTPAQAPAPPAAQPQ